MCDKQRTYAITMHAKRVKNKQIRGAKSTNRVLAGVYVRIICVDQYVFGQKRKTKNFPNYRLLCMDFDGKCVKRILTLSSIGFRSKNMLLKPLQALSMIHRLIIHNVVLFDRAVEVGGRESCVLSSAVALSECGAAPRGWHAAAPSCVHTTSYVAFCSRGLA